MAYTFNPESGRYRDEDGALVSIDRLTELSTAMAASEGDAYGLLADLLADGTITLDEWDERMRDDILAGIFRQYVVGRGGSEQIGEEDWEIVAALVAAQYEYFSEFLAALQDGSLSLERARERAKAYAESQRQSYWWGVYGAAKRAGYAEERRLLGPVTDHCTGCPPLADLGWQPIGSLPNPGDGGTPCLYNCYCTKQYRRADGTIYGGGVE